MNLIRINLIVPVLLVGANQNLRHNKSSCRLQKPAIQILWLVVVVVVVLVVVLVIVIVVVLETHDTVNVL